MANDNTIRNKLIKLLIGKKVVVANATMIEGEPIPIPKDGLVFGCYIRGPKAT